MICRVLLGLKTKELFCIMFSSKQEALMLANLRKNLKGILLMLLCALALTMGQFVWKLDAVSTEQKLMYIALGLCIYGCGAIVMITAYRFGSISVLQPVNSVGYIYALIIGAVFFGETVSFSKALGVVLIIAGVILLAGGDEQ